MNIEKSIKITIADNFLHKNDYIEILQAVFKRVDPENAVETFFQYQDNQILLAGGNEKIDICGDIYIFGLGKAAQKMALGAKHILEASIKSGILITKHIDRDLEKELHPKIKVLEGDHPIPTEKSVSAAQSAMNMLQKLKPDDIVICLISGGGSALAVKPKTGITIEDYQSLTRKLLACGASIEEINVIRQQIDEVKGGGLLRHFHPATVISLILSDVVGDPLDMIASGPTVASSHTREEAVSILEKYDLIEIIPSNIKRLLCIPDEGDERGTNIDLVKEENKVFTYFVGNNTAAALAAKKTAENLGYSTAVMTTQLQGEAREVGERIARDIIADKEKESKGKQCKVYGGETTVTMKGNGRGGRNQELALAAAIALDGAENCCLISLATDGEDGPTDAAGAIVNGATVSRGLEKNLVAQSYLDANDSYTYHDLTKGLVVTGPSGTNVNDLVLVFIY